MFLNLHALANALEKEPPNVALDDAMRSAMCAILEECEATHEAHSYLIAGVYWKLYDDRIDNVEKQRRICAQLDFMDIDPQRCFGDVLFLIQNHHHYDKEVFKYLFDSTSTGMLMPPNRPVPGDELPVGNNNDDDASTAPPTDVILHEHRRRNIPGNTDDGISSCTNSSRSNNVGKSISEES